MYQVRLSDRLYEEARKRANEAGFQNVDDYIAEIVECDVSTATANFDDFFTPEVVAHLNQIQAEVHAGAPVYSQSEVDEHLRRKSQTWRETRGN